MKKYLFFAILTLLLTIPSTIFAASVRVDVGQLRYTVDTNAKTAEVYGPISTTVKINDLVIPDYINYNGSQVPVTSISHNAFSGWSGLTGSLTIGNSVITIGYNAFFNCVGLSGSLTIGNSVTTIEKLAFYLCSGLTGSLTIGDSVTSIGDRAFSGCSGFTGSLTIGNSVTSIGEWAFYACSGLTGSLTLGDSVTSIGDCAFWNCSGFNGSLTIGDSVTSIGGYAFANCPGFTGSLTIGESVTSIGHDAFRDCSGFNGSLTIGDSVTSIDNSAFAGCSGLTGTLTIGDSVTSIGDYAFHNCSGFTGPLTIGDSVTSIGKGAFEGCSNISMLYLESEKINRIYDYAFSDMPALQFITCYSNTPPVCFYIYDDNYIFSSYAPQLNVPAEAIDKYKTATEWKKFTNIQPIEPATSISLNKSELDLKVGENETLIASLLPENATDYVEWTVIANPEGCVTVENGKVTAVAPGTATVTATAGEFSDSCKVTVTQPVEEVVIDFESMGISGDELEMHVGDSKEIVVNINPADASDKSLTFVSADNDVATVNEDGVITAVALGSTTITVTAENGVSATLKVSVIATPTTSITLNLAEVILDVNETVQLIATVAPDDASDKTVTWSTAEDKVATVDEDGMVTAVSTGTTTITATTVDGLTAECSVTVSEESGVSGIYDNGLRVSVNGSVIKVTGAGDSIVRIMAADGKPVFTAHGDCHANVVPGFYLVVVGDTVTKVVAKY